MSVVDTSEALTLSCDSCIRSLFWFFFALRSLSSALQSSLYGSDKFCLLEVILNEGLFAFEFGDGLEEFRSSESEAPGDDFANEGKKGQT